MTNPFYHPLNQQPVQEAVTVDIEFKKDADGAAAVGSETGRRGLVVSGKKVKDKVYKMTFTNNAMMNKFMDKYENKLNVFIKNSWLSPVKIRTIKFKFTNGFIICDENESIYKIRIYRKTRKNSLNYKMELPEIDLQEPLLNLVNYISNSIKNRSNKIFVKKFNVDISKTLQEI